MTFISAHDPYATPTAPGTVTPDQSTVVVVDGDIDTTTLPALRVRLARALGRATEAARRHLVIDLSRVAHCTTAGLALLIDTQRRAHAYAGSMTLAGPGPQLTHLMRTTGLDRRLTVRPT
ncbi:MAG: STAS domain-containing protein, partial [Actinophytocola sp.]|nr:STAS domain-containing protein [Actinophytocola sp.]